MGAKRGLRTIVGDFHVHVYQRCRFLDVELERQGTRVDVSVNRGVSSRAVFNKTVYGFLLGIC